MATLPTSTLGNLEAASRTAISSEQVTFADLMRGNIQLGTAIATQLAILKSSWSSSLRNVSKSSLPGPDEGIDQHIATKQPATLATWLRVNRQIAERISLELTEISDEWTSGIVYNQIGPLTVKGAISTHDGSKHVVLPPGNDGEVLAADSTKDEGLAFETRAAVVHVHAASDITTGLLALARGGTNADLSATGGTSQVLQQASAGAAITVGQLAASDLSDGSDLVVGPASPITNNAIARFDGTSGKIIQNSLVTIDDTTGTMTFAASASIKAPVGGGGNLSIVPDGNLDLGTVSTDAIKMGRSSGPFIPITVQSETKLQFRDTGLYINSSLDGTLDIVADTILAITAPAITVSGTVDGRDVAADGTKLDGIEAAADVTDATNVNSAGAVMNADVDAKGDILVATANDTLTNLGVGTNDQVLTAASGEASGVKWADAAAGSGDVTAAATLVEDQIIVGGAAAKAVLDCGVSIDPDTQDMTGLNSILLIDEKEMIFGTGSDVKLFWETTANDHFVLGIKGNAEGGSGFVSIMNLNDVASANRSPDGTTDFPRLRIYAHGTNADEFIEFHHNSTNPAINWDSTARLNMTGGNVAVTAGNLQVTSGDLSCTGSLTVDTGLGDNLNVGTNYLDWAEIAAPSSPGSNVARMYCKDSGGTTRLFYRDSGGTETEIAGDGEFHIPLVATGTETSL